MQPYDELLEGAIDLHCHVDLEFSTTRYRKRAPEAAWLPTAEAHGMRGVLLKSHWWPTISVADSVGQQHDGEVELFSSVTLNPPCGGAEPWVVEAAAEQGARAVFLPTWASRDDIHSDGFAARIAELYPSFEPSTFTGAYFLDDAGQLTDTGHALLRACQERSLALGTGHISWEETLAFAKEAAAIDFRQLVFNHPLAGSISAPLEAVREIASHGCYVEFCWPNIAPGRLSPAAAATWLREVGLEHVVITSDYFRSSAPEPPELLRWLLGTLVDAGMRPDELRVATVTNPARVLGLE